MLQKRITFCAIDAKIIQLIHHSGVLYCRYLHTFYMNLFVFHLVNGNGTVQCGMILPFALKYTQVKCILHQCI